MDKSWQDSVVLITSTIPGESTFGTGFILHKSHQTTFLLTCTHVVYGVGGPDKIEVNGIHAEVVASSPEESADVAIVCIGRRLDAPPLSLCRTAEKGKPFSTAGFQVTGKQMLIRELHGILGKRVGVQIRGQAGRIKAWDLEITDEYPLQQGYSGSPVVDGHDCAIGVVNTLRGDGKRGVAVSIEAIEKVWAEMPSGLLMPPPMNSHNLDPMDPNFAFHEYLGRGVAHRGQKRYNEALDAYSQALGLNPLSLQAYIGKANVLNELKRYEEALAVIEQAVRLNSSSPTAHRLKETILNNLKRSRGAGEA